MKKILRAGAIAFAMIGLLSATATSYANDFASGALAQTQMPASIDVGRIKSVLRLTPGQEVFWPPVEMALRSVARQQIGTEPAGFVRRVSRQVVSIVLNSAAVERLAVAARPLIAALNDDQKRAASGLAQEMGLGPVVMAALR
jgi:hypothetical protein